MKLYLSSYKLGSNPEELLKLTGKNNHLGLILNAGDLDTPGERALRVGKNIKELESLGFIAEEIDLREYFGKTDLLRGLLNKFGAVWVKGGNIFILKRAFEQSGFDSIIVDLIKHNSLVYAAESAGAVVVGPTLEGLDLVDNPADIPDGYVSDFSMKGLNLIDYVIAPHYKSNHPESVFIDNVVEYFINNHIPYKTLRDGEVIIIDK